MQKSKYIKKSCFSCAILPHENSHLWDIFHSDVIEHAKITNSQRFYLHNARPFHSQNRNAAYLYHITIIDIIQEF